MCFICESWEDNQLSSEKAFRLIGDSLKLVPKDQEDYDHLMELCDRIIESVDRAKSLHS